MAAHCAAQTLTIGVQADESVQKNISRRIVEEAFRRARMEVVFKAMPLSRTIEEANDGIIDGDLYRLADVAATYPNLITVPTPIIKVYLMIYGHSPELTSMTREQIEKMRILYPRGVLLARKYTQGMNATEAPANWFEMLIGGRIDYALLSYVDAEGQLARQQPPAAVVRWPHVWASEPLFLILNRRHADLVPRIDAAFGQMKQEGLIDRYYDDAMRESRIPLLPRSEMMPSPAKASR